MEETRRSLFSLATVCCLLFGAFLPLPGDGQTQSSAAPSTVSHLSVPLSSLSPQTTAPTVTSVDGNSTVTSQLNANGSSSPELPAPATIDFLNITTESQEITSRNDDNATINSAEANQTGNAGPIITTSWVNSSTSFSPTNPFQSKETQEPTATPQPKSSTFSILATATTKRTLETMPVSDHEAIREESTAESTLPPSTTVIDGSILTLVATTTRLTSEAASSTFSSHRTTPVEIKKLTNHVWEKTSGLHIEDYGENLPSMPTDGPVGEDPLVIAVIFIFIVTVGILALMGFLKYRQRNSRLQFRRLQDLPMDDMMEDTPLSLYSY
ncbi:uncharacterized protein LOC129330920 [Eublepharis macularius]|uniref:Uncharacterized protein LOC129330920 n=1 Tax=Eublepharis macularius TaxID=481883 RepID=A0AA97KZW7_EUBMA|nr:uncharacterized protein LOC129330920 [Eublepharis macularius]